MPKTGDHQVGLSPKTDLKGKHVSKLELVFQIGPVGGFRYKKPKIIFLKIPKMGQVRC